jgi:hypothetical protein
VSPVIVSSRQYTNAPSIPSLALLLMAVRPVPAGESWEFDFRKCHVQKRFPQGEYMTGGTFFPTGENEVTITIDSDEISELEKAVTLLKKCDKFWNCVADREKGKRKHCYMPKDLPQ